MALRESKVLRYLQFPIGVLVGILVFAAYDSSSGWLPEPGEPTSISLYADGLGDGWKDWSWGDHDLADTTNPSTGDRAIRFDYDAWDGLYLRTEGLAITKPSTLRFAFNPGDQSDPAVAVRVIAAGETFLEAVEIGPYCQDGLVAQRWTICRIPIGVLTLSTDAAPGPIEGIAIQEWAGVTLDSVYIDDIAILETDPNDQKVPGASDVASGAGDQPGGASRTTEPSGGDDTRTTAVATSTTTAVASQYRAGGNGPPPLRVQGQELVNPEGVAVRLRGADLLRSEWDRRMDFERVALPELADWGANVIKRGYAANPVVAGDNIYLEWLDEYVSLAAEHDMYVIFSFRSHEINGDQPRLPNANARRSLEILAERYRKEHHVMFSIQEEPHDVTWDQVQAVFQEIADAVYASAAPFEPVVIIPGVNWSRELAGPVTSPVKGPNVIYKTHPHNRQSEFGHQFIGPFRAGLPVLIGNFGPVEFGGDYDSDLDDVDALLDWTDKNDVGWIAWMFDEGGGPGLISSNETFEPTEYGRLVKKRMR